MAHGLTLRVLYFSVLSLFPRLVLSVVVSPTAFSFNREAAEDNYFMDNPEGTLHEKDVRTAVLREYAALYDRLVDRSTGVGAVVHLFT